MGGVLGHALTDGANGLEAAGGVGGDVPLAGHVGFVACFGEELRPENAVFSFGVEFGVNGLSVPHVASGDEHGPTGDTHGWAP